VITPEQRSYMNRRACDVGLSILAQERRGLNSWKRVDLFVVKLICQPGALRQLLSQGYRFALAHAFGYVGRNIQSERLRCCRDCTFKTSARLPLLGQVDYCEGDNGGHGCGCAKHPLWPFSTLAYKTSLGTQGCPIGKFPARVFDCSFNLRWWSWCIVGVTTSMLVAIVWSTF